MDEYQALNPAQQGAQRPRWKHTMSLLLLIFLPWAMFVFVAIFWTFVYHDAPALVWAFVALCIGISIIFVLANMRKQGSTMFWIVVGVLCFFATVLGSMGGFWNYYQNMAFYWAYEGQRLYSNVIPTEPALAHLDAGALHFSQGTTLDKEKATGHSDGSTYCVAPIVDSTDQSHINYFAAGEDCCGNGGSFTCDDAGSSEARQGLVILRSDPSPLSSNDLGEYRQAAQECAREHSLTVDEDALFVRWVRSTEQAEDAYWSSAIDFLLGSCGVYLAVSLILGCTLHFGSRPPRAAKDGRQMRSL